MSNLKYAVLCAVSLMMSTTIQADVHGGFVGRTVNVQDNKGTAVEVFYKSFSGAAYGARVSHRYNDNIIVFADYAQREIEFDYEVTAEGTSFGGGLFYLQPELIDGFDAAIKLSYHTGNVANDAASARIGNFSIEGLMADMDSTEIVGELILSSKNTITDSGLKWYAGLGAHQIKDEGRISQRRIIDRVRVLCRPCLPAIIW